MDRKRARFEKAVETKGRDLVGMAITRNHQRDDALDLSQDVVVFALQFPDWQGIDDVGAWMYQVWKNYEYNHTMRTARRTRVLAPRVAEGECVPVDYRAETDDEAERKADLFASIMEASARAGLTHRQDYVFLAKTNGQDNDEIARALGISTDSVRATYSVALDKIRGAMGLKTPMQANPAACVLEDIK